MAWYSVFIPDLVVKSYKELKVSDLLALDCRVLLIDIDNTLVPHDQELPDKEVFLFIERIIKAGIVPALVSNNTKVRVRRFATALDLKYYASAKKPLTFTYKKVMKDFTVDTQHFVCLGDQLLTDVWGAHRAQVKVIWSYPLVERDIFYTRFNRMIERFIYRTLVRKGKINAEV